MREELELTKTLRQGTDVRDRLILALDMPSPEAALSLVDAVSPTESPAGQLPGVVRRRLAWVKVGHELFTAGGPDVVRALRQRGLRIFLDLKYHDIPNTVARAAEAATGLGVAMFNVHAAGGREMMAAAVAAARRRSEELGLPRPLVVAVTVLTSLDQTALHREVGLSGTVEAHVERFALAAREAGCDGVVASPREVERVKAACGPNFLTVTPGVRPGGAEAGDQRRTLTPGGAILAGADYLVVGRPISQAPDPAAALERILTEMEEALIHA